MKNKQALESYWDNFDTELYYKYLKDSYFKQAKIKFVLHEVKRLEDNLWEVWIDYHFTNSTVTTKSVSHHSSKREAEEQRTINKFKTLGL